VHPIRAIAVIEEKAAAAVRTLQREGRAPLRSRRAQSFTCAQRRDLTLHGDVPRAAKVGEHIEQRRSGGGVVATHALRVSLATATTVLLSRCCALRAVAMAHRRQSLRKRRARADRSEPAARKENDGPTTSPQALSRELVHFQLSIFHKFRKLASLVAGGATWFAPG
jgi:hypothetical protein